jgi:hypothetical protein
MGIPFSVDTIASSASSRRLAPWLEGAGDPAALDFDE